MSPFYGRHVHLLGIGGSGVSALVPLLQAQGATVSGCDSQESSTTQRLTASKVAVAIGHDPCHVAGADIVVHTAAVAADHPELVAARLAGARVLTRGACLIELMSGMRTLAVSGSHGKTSTTWFAGHLLTTAGADPLVMVGGSVASLGGGARAGRGGWFVAEVDESDGSFAGVRPQIAIVTNLDREHLRHYGSFANLERTFHEWLRTLPSDGLAVVPANGLAAQITGGIAARVLTVGLESGDCHAAELELGGEGSTCRVILHGRDLGPLHVPIPGAHMVANALMALVAARVVHPGVRLADLASCERVGRRFRVHGIAAGVRVVEDYGHHPAEIRATVAAARLGGGRVHVLFQPHRHTRTQDCFAEFITAFDQAQQVVLLPIYGAGEEPIAGVTSAALAAAISERRCEPPGGTVQVVTDRDQAPRIFADCAASGDTILILGAGDVGECAPRILDFFVSGRHKPALSHAEALHVCA
jgi:UDP-N-acetylmuramate--alanine ligase